jgi:hypothetical protein
VTTYLSEAACPSYSCCVSLADRNGPVFVILVAVARTAVEGVAAIMVLTSYETTFGLTI